MALLNLRPLHRIVIFAIENHFSLIKWPPYFQYFPLPVMLGMHLYTYYIV